MERNITLDYFKLLCAFIVIISHSGLATNGFLGWNAGDGFGRIAVPCFFVINGYYLLPVVHNSKKFRKYIFHIILIYLVWSIVYFPDSLSEVRSIKNNILMVVTRGYAHLWYMVSLIGASLLLYILKGLKPVVLLILSLVLYYTGFFMLQSNLLFGLDIHFTLHECRNFLFMGFPYVCAGYCINRMQLEKKDISSKLLLLISGILSLCLLAEVSYIYFHYLAPSGMTIRFYGDFYIFTILLCPLLVLTILKMGKYGVADGYISKLATGIYFVHYLVLAIVRTIWGGNPLFNLILVFFLSAVIAAGVIAVNKRLKIFL